MDEEAKVYLEMDDSDDDGNAGNDVVAEDKAGKLVDFCEDGMGDDAGDNNDGDGGVDGDVGGVCDGAMTRDDLKKLLLRQLK